MALFRFFLNNKRLQVVLDGRSLQKCPIYISVHYAFPAFIKDLPDYVIGIMAVCADETTLYSKCDQASDLLQQGELASELELDL